MRMQRPGGRSYGVSGLGAIALLCGLAVGGCGEPEPPPPSNPSNVVLQWNRATTQAISDTAMSQPISARALAIVHTCMYDAWAAYDVAAHATVGGNSRRRPPSEWVEDNKRKAISYAAYEALRDLFPGEKPKFDALLSSLGYDPNAPRSNRALPEGLGYAAAQAVLELRREDGANQSGDLSFDGSPYGDFTGYLSLNPELTVAQQSPMSDFPSPGGWQPLVFVAAAGQTVQPNFVAPQFAELVPFALSAPDQLRPLPPPEVTSGEHRGEVGDALLTSAQLTDPQKAIAAYWAEEDAARQPVVRWSELAQRISERDGHTLDQDVRLFFALGSTWLDTSIATWEAKRYYDFWRPISAVRYFYNGALVPAWAGPGRGTLTISGEGWRPFQPSTAPTHPSPEYPAAASAFAAASAEVLRLFTSRDDFKLSVTIAARSLPAEPSAPAAAVTLSWPTLNAAVIEAGQAGLYGGTQFASSDKAGRALGTQAASQAYQLANSYWQGTDDGTPPPPPVRRSLSGGGVACAMQPRQQAAPAGTLALALLLGLPAALRLSRRRRTAPST